MPSTAALAPVAVDIAHPVLEHSALVLPAPLIASVGAWAVFVLALALPESPTRRGPQQPVPSWEGRLSTAQVATRCGAVAVLLVTVAAGRVGADDELENIAPALVVGAGWPLLVLLTALAGPIWRWFDPWDALARPLTRGEPARADALDAATPDQVWPAVALALPWVWFLSATADPLDPRSVGTLLAVYTVVTVAGCLALGRQRWLTRAEPLGIVLSWTALLPRGRLVDWAPPRGAEALIGVLAGGLVFGVVRRSQQWTGVDAATGAWAYAALGLLGSCAAGAGLLMLASRLAARVDGSAAVARAMVPALAGIVVAVAMARNRLTTSVQLLPGLLGDPFGQGWDLFGSPLDGLDPAPLGETGLLVAQLAVLLVGHLAGALVASRRLDRAARMPAVVALAVSMTVATVAVPLH